MAYLHKSFLVVLMMIFAVSCAEDNGSKTEQGEEKTKKKDWALVIHGGAGAISQDRPDSVKQAYMADLDSALAIGEEVLKNGGKAIDAVEKVINYLENNP
ncbi:MAG: isoaspartyl peptidase/L-asparaginase, partial [Balneolaceae bacterium]|nr:isoaspartyl peptidase/L-asparaginase [Balneolaceae bacterium]